MNDCLGRHPDIFMGPKETHYFGSDLQWSEWYERLTEEDYLAGFRPGRGKPVLGEASVWYLYSKRAAEEIHRFNPNAKIIAMLRNPVDAMQSLHNQMAWGQNEPERDFAKALALEAERKRNGFSPPRGCHNLFFWAYRDIVSYADQVARFLDRFGPERTLVLTYDEFAEEPLPTCRRVFEFLGVRRDFTPMVARLNVRKQVRGGWIITALKRREPKWLFALARLILPPSQRIAMGRRLTEATAKPGRVDPIDPGLRVALSAELADEIGKLEELLSRDLSAWRATEGKERPA
jgi:hypothetical protein